MSGDVLVRIVLELLVMVSCGMWVWSLRNDWLVFTRRARRVSVAIFALILANAYGILHTITVGRPVNSATWVLFMAYLALNLAMAYRPRDDNTTARQYVPLLARLRLHR